MFTKKIKTFILAGLLTVSGSCFAQYDNSCYEQSTCQDCCLVGEPSGQGIYFGVDFLLWKYCTGDLDFANVLSTPILATPFVTATSKYQYIDHKWQPGFRINLGKLSTGCGDECGWDFMLSYTWNRGKESENITSPGTTQLVSTLLHGGINATPNPVASGNVFPEQLFTSHKYRYQTLEALVGRTVELNACQTIQPFVGIQGLKYDQVWNQLFTLFGDDLVFPISVFQSREFQARWDSTYEGLGLIVGANYNAKITDCLELFARGSYSILAGAADLTNKQQYIYDTIVPLVGQFDTLAGSEWHRAQSACTSGMHIKAGVNYIAEFCSRELLLSLSYEFVGWFNLPQMMRAVNPGQDWGISTSTNNSRVMFHGLSLGFNVEI